MRRLGGILYLVYLSSLTISSVASASVNEPSGLAVPIDQSMSTDYFDSRRYTANTLGIQTLLDTWEGTGKINAYADASATSVYFSPLCNLNAALILRGDSCQVDFGWYCADDVPGKEVIYPIVTFADIIKYHDVTIKTVLPTLGSPPAPLSQWTELQNNDKGFVPTVQSGYLAPVAGSNAWLAIRNSIEFLACPSRKIGFAFRGNPTSICPMSKFVDSARNQMSTFGSPWINAVVYPSKRYLGSYYIAFEDMPTSPESFTPALSDVKSAFPQMTNKNNGWESWRNDGDFNDFVYKVDGVQCNGGGQPCTPTDGVGNALQGACSFGVTACAKNPDTQGVCQQLTQPTAETCNGRDDDCDGETDEGTGLCTDGFACTLGRCAGRCGAPDFPCPENTVCELKGKLAGTCVPTKCANVMCASDQRCDELTGNCVASCSGVTCSTGQVCVSGSCLDPCAGVTCPSSFVCERGACIPHCTCQPCTDPSRPTCDIATGRCLDTSCSGVVCGAYLACVAGACINPCNGNPCGDKTCVPSESGTYTCVSSTLPGTGGVPNVTGGSGSTRVFAVGGATSIHVTSQGGTGTVVGAAVGGFTTQSATGQGGSHTSDSTSQGGASKTSVDKTGGNANANSSENSTTLAQICAPGRSVACSCDDGSEGAQECATDGKSFEPCVCTESEDSERQKANGCGCTVPQSMPKMPWVLLGILGLLSVRRRRAA
jgi:MYXO-CTERM domain-containing protein